VKTEQRHRREEVVRLGLISGSWFDFPDLDRNVFHTVKEDGRGYVVFTKDRFGESLVAYYTARDAAEAFLDRVNDDVGTIFEFTSGGIIEP